MKKQIISLALLMLVASAGFAQRYTDRLDRGLVAMKVSGGVYLSWRVLAEEYYDVTYNVYRDGTLVNAEPIKTSNFRDTGGNAQSTYTVVPVYRGQEMTGTDAKAVTPWASSYKEIKLTHEGILSTLVPNDACCADVDGDGEIDILMKFDNLSEMEQSYPKNGPTVNGTVTHEYSIFECLKQDGTRLWWVNCGPNMGDFQNNEQNIVAYDWDGDGRAEAIMRAADGTVIHAANGQTYTVGNANLNYRAATGGGTNWFMHDGAEYLVYMDGATGVPYQIMEYPLKRLESGENDLERAWGDGYGHRSSKHFFGAPYLDGRRPSIFLARGIYTRHKMVALDVDPGSHTLSVRWRWTCNTHGPWFGNGYHNFGIADVDWDGRDEIVFGSMVIDDNGKGLSTTGFGHGDAQHCSDFNPYVHGQEIYACLEHSPNWGNNYRDATTSKVYHHNIGGRDDGRCMAGNFTNAFPGSLGCSSTEGAISLITNDAVSGLDATGVNTNFRIYWDGDLCSETFNYLNGKNTEGCIAKYGSWSPIYTCAGSMTNNDTKGTPCYQGDILGDWREEIIMRTAQNNIRIYSSPTQTSFRIPTLWADHQYRNAMVWQMCGYNQPPHLSYFLGQMEGITVAPPPLTMNDRVEVTNGGSVSSAYDGQHAIVCEMDNSSVSIDAGAQPAVLTFYVPTWVQGTAGSESTNANATIRYATYTCDVTGGGLAGEARLVKQGDGVLNLPKADFTHTGETDIWAGVVNFDGTMKESPLWLNRFAELNSDGGEFLSIKADYASVIRPGGADKQGVITTGSLALGFGAHVVVDLYSDGVVADKIVTGSLSIETKTSSAWKNAGPEYLAPVIELVPHYIQGQSEMKSGKYVIAEIAGDITGSIDNLIIKGLETTKKKLYVADGKLILEIEGMRDAGSVVWTGTNGNVWDLAETENFAVEGEATSFVSGDNILFGDDATSKNVTVTGNVQPASVTVNSTGAYTFGGNGTIAGTAQFIKEGTGTVTMNGQNAYTGGNHLRGGTTRVSALANQYSATGNLGAITTAPNRFTIENGAVLQTTAAVENASPIQLVGDEGGVLNNGQEFIQAAALSGTQLTKRGAGNLKLMTDGTLKNLVIAAGSASASTNKPVATVEFQGGTLYDDVQMTAVPFFIPKGKKGTFHLSYTYYTNYTNKVTGEGELTIIPRNTVSRVRISGDWSQFEGTIHHTTKDIWLPLDMSAGMPKGTLDIDDGCTVTNVAKTMAIGKLTGKGSLAHPISNFQSQSAVSGSNTWNIGNSNDENFTFDGTFTDGGGSNKCNFAKIGTCKMTVSGKSNHTGTTQVRGGELCIKSGAQLGTGALTVARDATLSGVTSTSVELVNSSVTVSTGGTLHVGTSANALSGILRFGGNNVTIASGAFLEIGVLQGAVGNSTGCTSLQNINKLTMNGTVRLHYSSTIADDIAEGDHILLWKDVTTVSGTPVLDPESVIISAEKGLYWDTTDIAQGILRVAYDPAVAIRGINATEAQQPVYTIDGRRVNETRRGQVYIVGGRKVLVK